MLDMCQEYWYRSTYACHELEYTGLCLIEENRDFVETGNHLRVLADGTRHSASQGISKVVVNVEFTWRTWSKKSVV